MDGPWDFSGKNTGVGCHFIFQGIFLTQGLNPRILHSVQFSSVAQLCLTLCNPNEPQHARPPCPSPTPGVPDTQTHVHRVSEHPAISSSVVPFSSFPQSLPASGSFPMSQLSASGGQSIGLSALVSVLPMNTQD